jgi:uncharacterized RDD family membrane protein YckC
VALLAAGMAAPAAAQVEINISGFDNPTLRVLQDYTLRQGDTARQVVVLGGDARIEGTVTEDVVVVLGRAQLASTAVIEGSFVVVGGSAEIADGAKVERDMVVVGGARTPTAFSPGGQHVVIGTTGLGDSLRGFVPWLTRGLLLGRPIVPSLGWVWMVAGIFFLLNLCLNLLFDRPIAGCAATLRATPFSAFMAGLLILLLVGPVCVLLAISVIGIAVIPFVVCALLAAGILGRIGFARWIGMSLIPQADIQDRGQSLRSFVVGSAVMCVAYVIPFLGFVLWILAGVFGLGAAALAFYSSYRRENPKPPRPAPVVSVPPAPVAAPAAVAVPPDLAFDAPHVAPAESAVASEPAPAAVTAAAELPRRESFLGYPKATFAERLAALALDTILVAMLANFLDFDRYGGSNERLMLLVALAYHVGFWTWRGTTVGGIICQLRVVRVDGRPVEFAEAVVRALTGIFSLAVIGLGFFWILRDPERQGWHDRVAGTYVIKVPRG